MLVAALAAVSLGQTVPESASVIFPCFPESDPVASVQMPTHSVTCTLDRERLTLESLSTFRNSSDKPVTVQIRFPVRGRQVNYPQVSGYTVSAAVNKTSTTLAAGVERKTEPDEKAKKNGIVAATYERVYSITLNFKAKETKSVAYKFKAPLGKAGLDAVQRMVVYETSGASQWNGSVGQFNYAMKYPKNLILQVFAALPDGKWQVGPTGAFIKSYDYKAPIRPFLIFTYYPNSLEEIGG